MKWARKYLSPSSSKTDEPQGKAARSAIGPCSATGQPRRPHVLAKPIDPKVLLAAVLGRPAAESTQRLHSVVEIDDSHVQYFRVQVCSSSAETTRFTTGNG